MAVPDYQSLMLPMLEALEDGLPRRVVPDITDALAARLGLSTEDREQRLPSGVQSTFYNRSHWAATYLAKAGLLERPSRGYLRITARGRTVVDSKPARVDVTYLRRFPEFEEFRTRTPRPGGEAAARVTEHGEQNPEELLYLTYDTLRLSVEAEILERLQSESLSWEFFERLVVDLLGAMGYGGTAADASRRVTKRSGDEGIDGVIDEDRLGLDAVYIQAKKYATKNPVGRPALQAFAGSMEGQQASKGVFITTSHFTNEAQDYVRRISRRIVLIDGRNLARLMYEHGIGVRSRRSLDVRRVDEVYFEGDL